VAFRLLAKLADNLAANVGCEGCEGTTGATVGSESVSIGWTVSVDVPDLEARGVRRTPATTLSSLST